MSDVSTRRVIRESLTTRAITDDLLELLAPQVGVPQAAIEHWLARYESRFEWRAGALEALATARRSGRVVTLSNVCEPEDVTPAWRHAHIDASYSSWATGFLKPDPRAYQNLIESEGVEPSEVVHIGDTWGADVEGPLAAGMHSIFVGDASALPRLAGVYLAVNLTEAIPKIGQYLAQ